MELARCGFIDRRGELLALGSSGTSKTHVVCGLGQTACQKGRKVGFTTAAALIHDFMQVAGDRRLPRLQKSFANVGAG